MRVLIYSDVHANWEALQAMASYADGRYDVSLCLGDLVGYGADPNLCSAWVRDRTPAVIRGNHDRACAELYGLDWFNAVARTAATWTHGQLLPQEKSWLATLPAGPMQWEGLVLAHGSPLDEDEYIVSASDAQNVFRSTSAPWQFIGHTHLQCVFRSSGATNELEPATPSLAPAIETIPGCTEFVLKLQPDMRYLINPGSIGQPRDGDWRAAFALLDTSVRELTLCRVAYDLSAAQEKILAAGLPDALARRLTFGR